MNKPAKNLLDLFCFRNTSALKIFFFLILLVPLLATIQLRDPDTWWLLATGKLFFNGGIPDTNTFSFTNPNYPLHPSYWLFGSILYIAERIGGIYGVQIVTILFVFCMAYILSCTALRDREKNNWLLFIILLSLILVACRFRFVPRPHLASYLCFAILYNLWTQQPKYLLIWTGLLGFVWGNLHAGVIFGAVSFCLFAIGCGLHKDWLMFMKAIVAGIIFFASSLLNFDFMSPYIYALEHAWKFNVLNIHVDEFTSPTIKNYRLYYVLSSIILLSTYLRIKAKDYTYPVLVFFWFAFSFKAVRGIPYVLIISFPGLYASLYDLLYNLPNKLKHRWLTVPIAVLCVGVSLWLINSEIQARGDIYKFGLGINERELPIGACNFIEKERFIGRMYNNFGDGGFLIWKFFPKRKVFQDGRTQAYPVEFLKKFNSVGFHRNFIQNLNKFNIQYAIVWRQTGGVDRGTLFDLAGWPMVYIDGYSAIFVRPGYLDRTTLTRLFFQTIPYEASKRVNTPHGKPRPGHKARAIYELKRINIDSLRLEDDFKRFAFAAWQLGEFNLAEKIFLEGIKYFPSSSLLDSEYNKFIKNTGRTKSTF